MPSFFDRFRDLDDLKERAEALLEQGLKEGRRQAEMIKLRVKILDLERRMNAELRVLGERVWELHQVAALTPENLAGAFERLESLAEEIATAREEMERIERDEDAPAATPPPPPAPEPERRLEPEGDADAAPLE